MTWWSRSDPARFRVKDCDDDGAVVYDTIAGDTHVVDPLAMELIHMLTESAPRTATALVAGVAPLFDGETGAAIAAAVDEGLAQLQRLELVIGSTG